MGMFDNYTVSEAGNNMIAVFDVQIETLNKIVRGATNTHYFEFLSDITLLENVNNYAIIYKQGLSVILEKTGADIEVMFVDDETILIKCILTPEESKLFNAYNKDTFTQLSLQLVDGAVVYGTIYRIEVVNTLDESVFEESSEV